MTPNVASLLGGETERTFLPPASGASVGGRAGEAGRGVGIDHETL